MGVLSTRRKARRCCLLLLILLVSGAAACAATQVRAWYHYQAAQTSLTRYHFAEARNHLAIPLRVWPTWWRVHFLAARAARLDDAFEEARQHLLDCRPAQADNPEVLLERTLLRAASGDLAPVEAYLHDRLRQGDEAALFRPRQGTEAAPLILEALIKGYARTYRLGQAQALVEELLKRQPDDTQALFLRGCIWQQAQKAQMALDSYRRVMQLDPQRDDARWRLTQCLLRLGLSEEARAHLEYLHSRYPDNQEMTVELARVHLKQGQLAEARQLLQSVLAEHPDCVTALTERGRLAVTEEDTVEAEKWLRQAARLNPYNPPLLQLLSTTLTRQGKQEEARVFQDRFQQTDRDFKRLQEICLRELGRRPNDLDLQQELGTLLLRLGYQEAGRAWLLHALEADPNYAPARAALDKVPAGEQNP